MAAGNYYHSYRNSAQVDLCAHGTRCPFERFAVFASFPVLVGAQSTLHAFFIAASNAGR